MNYQSLPDKSQIKINPHSLIDFPLRNIRGKRDPSKEAEITESIRTLGIVQSLVARPSPDHPDKLELLGGYGRRDKAKRLEMTEVPVLVRQVDDSTAYAIHLAENMQREDLSIVDEARGAKTFMTIFAGDEEAAASALGIKSVKTLRERLELNRCSEKVLGLVERKTISAGHAILLAPFSHDVQDRKIDEIVEASMTVADLRLLLGKVQVEISSAKFDTTGCQSCNFNTAPQLGLFGSIDTKAKCSKPSCFKDKTNQWLQVQKEQAEVKYGTVIFLSQSSASERNTVNALTVGEEQYNEGCTSCASNVVVMDDSFEKGGMITESQCTDKVCFTKCKKANQEVVPDKASSSESVASHTGNQKGTTNTQTQKGVNKTPTVSKPSGRVVEQQRKILRSAAAQHFSDDTRFKLAVTLAAIASQCSYQIEDCKGYTFSTTLPYILGNLNIDQIKVNTLAAIRHLAESASSLSSGGNPTDIMINALKTSPDAVAVATKAWHPSKENIEGYTTTQLVQLAKNAGIDRAIDTPKPGEFAKLANGKKGDLLNAIILAKADTTEFAPADYLAHVTTKSAK